MPPGTSSLTYSEKGNYMMKRLFKSHFFLGRMADRTDDEFIDHVNETVEIKPEGIRWFCGMHDLDSSITCRML